MLFACIALNLAAVGCGRAPERKSPARHVIVISFDTTRADHFGFMGSESVRTPNLDVVARESIVFTDFMTVVPTTLASHTSLFTGKYPHSHGTPRNGFMVNADNVMLAEIMSDAGFHTAGFTGSFALDARFDFAQGFDHYDEAFNVMVGEGGADQNQRPAAEVTDAVIAYLDDHGVPQHLFLFAHYFDPHYPYAAPAPFDAMYDPSGSAGLPPIADLFQDKTLSDSQRDAYAHRWELQYASEISYMDHHVGRLIDDLKRRGVLDDALLVITSDHGENLWDHPVQFDHGFNLYKSTVGALCVVRLPAGENGGTTVDQVMANIDILPTVVEFLGMDAPNGIDGEAVDLQGVARQTPTKARFAQATKPWRGIETDPRWTNILKSQCIRDGRYKFIWTPYQNSEALYDVVSDPGETKNVLEDPTEETRTVAERLRRELHAWRESAKPLPSRFESSQQEETIKRLKALGYIK
jgi:arylsulfatase A-like enzyme